MKKIKKSRKEKNLVLQDIPVYRYQTDFDHGLSEEQVAERIEHRLVNDTKIKTSNSYLSIVCKNIFTFFNLIWFVIAIALMCVQAWTDLIFIFVVIANTAISIFQEIKSKATVEKLSMVTAPRIKVVRMGLEAEVRGEDLLLDDIVVLENGNQIPADCIIVDGVVEANESLLTGESNSIKKQVGDTLLAGSFLVSGRCYARVDKVGKNNYIQTVAERTKDFKPQQSNLFKDLNSLIKVLILILIPIGVLTFFKEIYLTGSTVQDAIKGTSGALTGMIPAGMYLLITVGLSVGVIKLARKKTLVKNLYSIEMLARANVLCLDKTGTITDGTMKVVDVVPLENTSLEKIENIMKAVLAAQKTTNATSVALVERFGQETVYTAPKEVVEFSSQRKFSATTLKNGKTYYIGAVGFIKCAVSAAQKSQMNAFMEKGLRVVALVEDENPYNEKTAGRKGKLLAFFALEDHIRKDAVETIAWFKKNNVQVKIISGDDALTVSKIAKRVGVEDADKFISLENMSLQEVAQIANKFTVFGRVTPEQKHTIIKTLKTQGNVVAMTGDGVNDTLALKEANCSIAMADGSEVARNISHLVLLESNFSALPTVVKEGRQIVNNVQYSSVLYLMKTLFTIMLCLTTLVLRIKYPFAPSQLLLLEMFVIGLPSYILTLQPNSELIRGNFIPQVLKKSIPCALLMFVNLLIVVLLKANSPTLTDAEFTSLCTMLLVCVGYINLVWVCWPLNWLRIFCLAFSATLIVTGIVAVGGMFSITQFTFPVMTTLITMLLCTTLVVVAGFYIKQWFTNCYATAEGKRPSLWSVISYKLKRKDEKDGLLKEKNAKDNAAQEEFEMQKENSAEKENVTQIQNSSQENKSAQKEKLMQAKNVIQKQNSAQKENVSQDKNVTLENKNAAEKNEKETKNKQKQTTSSNNSNKNSPKVVKIKSADGNFQTYQLKANKNVKVVGPKEVTTKK